MKLAASKRQRPPISRASTTSRARAALENSGYVLSLARRACCKAAPAVRPAARRGAPAAARGETRVVATASCTPQGQPVGYDLDPPFILSGRDEVEVFDQNIARNGSPSLPANASSCSLKRAATRPQHA